MQGWPRRKRWVLDNTYRARKSRNEVIECAWRHGVPVHCIHLTTSTADAQINAITRLIAIHGRLPMPEEIREREKEDPRYFGPDAQFRYERSVELPSEDEGFESMEAREFRRRVNPNATARGILMEYDEVLCLGAPLRAEDVTLADAVGDNLRQWHDAGWFLFAQAWRPQLARGAATREDIDACFARTRELLGVPIDLAYCPHDAGPPICWCRKPLPGLIVEFVDGSGIDLSQSVSVGSTALDRTLAQRLGTGYSGNVELIAHRMLS